ncbi:hypothetical protein Btru_067259 [Bulinus truncatus]|nr:hypothetical protein Btru_067259 [Bulinus truncatus]
MKVVMKKTLVQREVARRHFRREALLLQQVQHPNVVKLYEAMETTNSYYLVFELAPGGCILETLTFKGNFTEDESRHYMSQIISAVDHLHRSNIVHRDIKLENLLLDDMNNIKLVDFGLSAVCHDSSHHLNTLCGSPVYAAPELFAGRKYGRPVDIWSVGICFFAMLTGKLPFLPEDKTSLPQLYSLILKGFTKPSNLSQECQNLLSRMLEIQEGRRLTAEEILSHSWMVHPDGQSVKRVPAAPRRLHENSVNMTIIRYMCNTYRYNENDVINNVVEKRLTAAAATYNILKDGIESGHVTLTVPVDTLHDDSVTPSKKMSSLSLPRLDTRVQSRTSESSSEQHGGESEIEMATLCNKDNSSQQEVTRKLSDTYKSCILVLKRSRQHIRHGDPHPTDPHGHHQDYVVVGKSPRGNTHGNVLPCLSTHPATNHTTLPPIATNHLVLSGNLRYVRGQTHGRKQFSPSDPPDVFQLDIKGVSPSLFDRSSLTNAGSISTSFDSFSRGGFPSRNAAPPPPPPPNSSFGDATSHGKYSYLSRNDLTSSRKSSDPSHSIHGDDATTTSQSVDIDSRMVRDPLRPTLAALRDPYGRDTWRTSRSVNGFGQSKLVLRQRADPSGQQPDPSLIDMKQNGLMKGIRWNEMVNNSSGDTRPDFIEDEIQQTTAVHSEIDNRSRKLSPSKFLQQFNKLNGLQSVARVDGESPETPMMGKFTNACNFYKLVYSLHNRPA